jgi:cytoskeletal protein CcmA (bactofilin family)
MAISGFGRGSKGGTASGSTSVASSSAGSPASSGSGFGNLTAFIDQGSEFEGKLSFKDTVRIDGSFTGEITSDNTLIVGESGEIRASIRSVCVVISGLVEGNIEASEQIVLHKTARVTGDVVAPSLVIEQGAQLNGNVRMAVKPAASTASVASVKGGGHGQESGAARQDGAKAAS